MPNTAARGTDLTKSLDSMNKSSWGKAAIAVGWTGKALVYAVIAALTFQVASGAGQAQTSQQGALAAIASTSYGTILLTLLGIALLVYAAENVAEAAKVVGPSAVRKSGLQRAGRVLSALAHASLGIAALSYVMNTGQASGGGGSASQTTATVFSWPAGRYIVGLVALLVIGAGLYFIVKEAAKKGYQKTLSITGVSASTREWLDRISMTGLAARGLAFVAAGGFLLLAAIQYDPQEAKGLDQLLHTLAATSWGPWLMYAAALGLLAYAGYCLIQAKWRKAS